MADHDEMLARAAAVLWRSREFDTRDIAEVLVLSEAEVTAMLEVARERQVDFVAVARVEGGK
jgi:DNA-binding transcriptional regulator LsrR (DeoR family)